MGRKCGSCTACCEGWLESARMGMLPGKPCQHLCSGSCMIYARRPQNPCRDFDCGWKIAGSPLPEDMRPDRCGAIVILGQPFQRWDVVRAVPVGWSIPAQTLQRIKQFVVAQRMALIYHEYQQEDNRLVQTDRIGFGPPEFVEAFRAELGKDPASVEYRLDSTR